MAKSNSLDDTLVRAHSDPLKSSGCVLLFANTDWYLYNFRLSLAQGLAREGYRVVLASPPGLYVERLLALGFCWKPVEVTRAAKNPLRDIKALFQLYNLIQREQVSIVHSFTIKCACLAGITLRLLARTRNAPFSINAIAGMGYVFTSSHLRARLLRPIVTFLLQNILDQARTITVLQNKDDLTLLKESGLLRIGEYALIPGSGVDCDRLKPTVKTGRQGLKVMLAARLLWDKGIKDYVDAASRLAGSFPTAQFILAGQLDEGNPAAIPRHVLDEWISARTIEYIGHVDDVVELFSGVDIVVLPSYREGLPKSLIEAAACGLPLVTTDVPGCREVVTHEIDGLLVSPHDPEALADAIKTLLEDPDLRKRMGTAAREKAERLFDERIIIEETIALYRRGASPAPS